MTQARTHTSAQSPSPGRRVSGVYLGIVTDRDDPRQLARVKVRVPELGGQSDLAWARVLQPVAGENTGGVAVPPIGALVHVIFEAEDQNRPVVIGAGWSQPSEASQIPLAARGEPDPIRDAPRGQDTATGADGAALVEPVDPYGPPGYPHNTVFKTPGGHLVELDDTAGKQRINVTHGPSKTWVEIHPDGTLVMGVKGKRYTLVQQDDAEHVAGRKDVVVGGDATLKSAKYTINCRGYRLSSSGALEQVAIGQASLRGQTVLIESATVATIRAPGITSIGPGVTPGNVLTTISNPFDLITGIPFVGTPFVQAG